MKTTFKSIVEEISYDDFFKQMLKKYSVESPDELSDSDKKEFFNDIKKEWKGTSVTESPVGSRGRTTHTDADDYINDNPQVIKEFMTIVKKMGGKAVARRILDRVTVSGALVTGGTISEAKQSVEQYLREVGYKIKSVTPMKGGDKEIEFYKEDDRVEAYEDLKTAGFLEDYILTDDGYKSLVVKEM